MSEQIPDPGFGTTASSKHARLVNREGLMNVRRTRERFDVSDIYHRALIMSWTKFLVMTVALYTVVNIIFAFAYLLVGIENIKGAVPGSWIHNFGEAMFLSAQTLTTVGYGVLSPGTPLMSSIAAIESMAGLLIFGIFTGLAFGRFSRMRPRFVYSKNILLAPYKNGVNALMVRFANERNGAIMDATATMMLVLEYHDEDRLKRQFYDLSLEISSVRTLALSWTLVHPVTMESPIYALSKQDLEHVHAEVIVVIHAYDDTVGQPFYARYSWSAKDVLSGHRFAPMFFDTADGVVEIDLSKISDTFEAELFPVDGQLQLKRERPQ